MIKNVEKIDANTIQIETDKKKIILIINDNKQLHKGTKMKKFKGFFKDIEIIIETKGF